MSNAVLVVEDDAGLREALCDTLSLAGLSVLAAEDGEQALATLNQENVGLVITDVQMGRLDGLNLLRRIKAQRPELPVLLMTAFGSIAQAVDAMREGAVDYLVKPFEAEVLLTKVTSHLPRTTASTTMGVVAVDTITRQVVALASRVARSDVTVMITGESGTGKEAFAQLVHEHSPRRAAPFVAINCAAIPDNMLEAVLFGYEKGAFTGAYRSCPGKFEQAQGGTLLLDEIAEMDLRLQVKLLRVLQEREVERLGGRNAIALDVRVLAASNRDMKTEVLAGRFRKDLYYRLNVFPLHLPALRERPADIVPLAEYLLRRTAIAHGRLPPQLSQQAQQRLLAYLWPGNVRELDNVMQRALVLQEGQIICANDLHFESFAEEGCGAGEKKPLADDSHGSESLGDDLWAAERRLILNALEAGGGNRTVAAKKLGISPRTLRYKLARLRADGYAIPSSGAA
jgi:two-component system response regulator FlrC